MKESFDVSLGNVSKNEELGEWYLNYSSVIDLIQSGFYGGLDKNGIPIVDYDKIFKNNLWYISKYKKDSFGIHYAPVTIAQYAFGLLSKYKKDNDENKLILFKKCADWFIANVKDMGSFGVWEHTWIEPIYDLKPPWISAMTQGEAISLLLRAYQVFNDNKYFYFAEKAFNSFKETNIVYTDKYNNIWYEENPTNPPNHILNGFIFALFGLFDFYRIEQDEESFRLWNEGIKTLEKNIHRYDSGYWSKYDLLFGRITSDDYHNLHICQLKVLYNLTGIETFNNFYNKWEGYKKSKICHLKRKINGRFYNRIISKFKQKRYNSIMKEN